LGPTVPGGSTGLLVKIWKTVGRQGVAEFQLDSSLLKELRATEQQISIERGEWLNKTQLEMRGDLPVIDVPEDASIETIREAKAAMKAALEKLKGSAGPQKKPTVQ